MADDDNELLSERSRLKSLENLQVEVSGFCTQQYLVMKARLYLS
jgi:hypothetical protein